MISPPWPPLGTHGGGPRGWVRLNFTAQKGLVAYLISCPHSYVYIAASIIMFRLPGRRAFRSPRASAWLPGTSPQSQNLPLQRPRTCMQSMSSTKPYFEGLQFKAKGSEFQPEPCSVQVCCQRFQDSSMSLNTPILRTEQVSQVQWLALLR